MSFHTPTTVHVTPTLSAKTPVAVHPTACRRTTHLPHTPKSQTVSNIPICLCAPQKSHTLQNGPSVNVEAIASDVFQSARQSPVPPTKPLRGLPYRAPSTWGPHSGPKGRAEAVIARVDSFMSVPALTSFPVACGPQPGKFKMTRTKIPQPARITPQLTKAKPIKTPGAPRKNVLCGGCPLGLRSNGRAMGVTPIENVVAAESDAEDPSENKSEEASRIRQVEKILRCEYCVIEEQLSPSFIVRVRSLAPRAPSGNQHAHYALKGPHPDQRKRWIGGCLLSVFLSLPQFE
ncbi:hypothetical protein BS47DRAFT_1380731 [Hydnum rufescens UP504]|uniref:Uncharacterized protein n=1 Tax=Hydnum rufescens UP504 TaxID=1448309 RepID=A0A9P6B3T3_9AGAM|nr:hypothetical protein BS47DRAFT_1380731 [Hydnum rufescens UP504]